MEEDQVLLDIIEEANSAGESEKEIARIIAEYEAQDGAIAKSDVALEVDSGDYAYQRNTQKDVDFTLDTSPPPSEALKPPIWDPEKNAYSRKIEEGETAKVEELNEVVISGSDDESESVMFQPPTPQTLLDIDDDEQWSKDFGYWKKQLNGPRIWVKTDYPVDEDGRRVNWVPPAKEEVAKEVEEKLEEDKKEDDKKEDVENNILTNNFWPTEEVVAETDATTTVSNLQNLEILEEEQIPEEYYDPETNTVVEETFDIDALINEDERPFYYDFDANKVYYDVPPVEEEESTDPADNLWINKYIFNPAKNLANITMDLIKNPKERAELALETFKIYSNMPYNLEYQFKSARVAMNETFRSIAGDYTDGYATLDWWHLNPETSRFNFSDPWKGDPYSDRPGVKQEQDATMGPIVFLGPKGETMSIEEIWDKEYPNTNPRDLVLAKYKEAKKILANKYKDAGWTLVYEKNGREVGSYYREWLQHQFTLLLEIEMRKFPLKAGLVDGYNEKDASKLFAGVVLSITSLAETMIPAIITDGLSLAPQVIGPMFTNANREKAKAMYPNLSEKDAIQMLINEGDVSVYEPILLGIISTALERVGLRGITKAMLANSRGFTKVFRNMMISGNKEGLTEWFQLGVETINIYRARGYSYEDAVGLSFDAMFSEQGLENYLMGLIGGVFVAGGGATINRALRSDPSSIKFVSSKINEIAALNKYKFTTEKGQDAIQRKIDAIVEELRNHVLSSRKIMKYLTKSEQKSLLKLIKKYDGLRFYYDGTKKDFLSKLEYEARKKGISAEELMKIKYPKLNGEWNLIKSDVKRQIDEIHEEIAKIKNTANERLLDEDIIEAEKEMEEGGVVVFENAAEIIEYLKDKRIDEKGRLLGPKDPGYEKAKPLTKKQRDKFLNTDGWYTGGDKVYVNKKVAINVGATSAATHEVLHFLVADHIRDEDGNITIEGMLLINSFLKLLPKKTRVELERRMNVYDRSDPNNYEEYLNFYIDAIKDGSIKPQVGFLKKWGLDISRIWNEKGYDKISFKTADDVLAWLNSYIEGKKSEGVKKKPTSKARPTAYSITDLKPSVDNLGKVDKATWDNGGWNTAFTYIYSKLDGVIKSKLPFEKPPSYIGDEDFIQQAYLELLPHLKNFNPEQNDSLWGWIMSQIQNKVNQVWPKVVEKDAEFTIPLDDEGSFVNEVEADIYTDIALEMENDVTFTELRKILGIERDGDFHKKLKKGIETIIPLELRNINDPKFKKNVLNYFKAKYFDDLKKIIGKPGSPEYKAFIENNAEALYNLFPQAVFNKQFQDFIVQGKRLNVSETKDAQDKGLVNKELTKEDMMDGIYLYTKLPFTEEVKQRWIDSFIKKDRTGLKGRPASKQNSLLDLFAWILGSDATMEIINDKEFLKNYPEVEVAIATIGLKLNRGINVRFSDTNGKPVNINANDGSWFVQQANNLARWISNVTGIQDLPPSEIERLLAIEFPGADIAAIKLIAKFYDMDAIINSSGKRFKTAVQADEDVPPKVKAQIKKDGTLKNNPKALEKIFERAEKIALALGPAIMNKLGYEFLGFKYGVLDAAATKEDANGNIIPGAQGEYYLKLEALKKKVNELGDVPLPDGLTLEHVELMNKKYKLFAAVERILNTDTTVEKKLIALEKLAPRIKEAGEANIEIAKHVAKTMITTSGDMATFIHMLQIQTSIVGGFRAWTTLDLITVLNGDQSATENHAYYSAELEIAKNAVYGPKHKKAGQLKYPTKEQQREQAILQLGTKGEHARANANTMADLVNLKARYNKDKSIDLDAELDLIFSKHGQIHGTKGTFAEIDAIGGTTNIADWLRIMIGDRASDMYSPDGTPAFEVAVEKEAESEVKEQIKNRPPSHSNTNLKITTPKWELEETVREIIENSTGFQKDKKLSDAQAQIRGREFKNAWDWLYPASAYDLELFIYRLLGKGAKGKAQHEWFKKNLFEPFEKAYKQIEEQAQLVKKEYRDLVKKLPKIRKRLNKTIPNSKLTYDNAIRVYLWNKDGVEIPGISKRDLAACIAAVEADSGLVTFADALVSIARLKGKYLPPSDFWTVETIAYDLQALTGDVNRAEALKQWKENVNLIFSKDNKNVLRDQFGNEYVEALEDMLYRMEFGRPKMRPGRIELAWTNWVNNSVGAIMFLNMRSAVLQTISSLNYIDWEDNTIAKAALAFLNVPQFCKDFTMIFNSDWLLERRSGKKMDINVAELTKRVEGSKNKANAIIAYLLELGFTPTQVADSFAISAGGAIFYRNKVKRYLKDGMSLKDAETQAMIDLRVKTEAGQQSSRPDMVSQQQAGGLGKLILAFKNTPMQYNRIMIKAILDIKNNRGKVLPKLSQIAYYGVIQSIIFTSLQTAIWAALGDDEDEWDEAKHRIANGMIDTVLNGLGLTGAVLATMKNAYLRYSKEKKRGWNADYTRVVLEFANLSPTIGSKLRKLYSGLQTEQFNQEAIDSMGLTIENPGFAALANLVAAVTNVPTDRAVTKINNILLASKSDTEAMDKIALLMGWNAWDLNLETEAKKINKKLKEEKKVIKTKKNKGKKKEADNIIKIEKGKKKQEQEKKEKKQVTCLKCKLPVIEGKKYCTVHEKKEQRKDGKKVQCEFIKGEGSRTPIQCGIMTSNKSGFCYYHD